MMYDRIAKSIKISLWAIVFSIIAAAASVCKA